VYEYPIPMSKFDDNQWIEQFCHMLIPKVEMFAPELIIVSAGFDSGYDIFVFCVLRFFIFEMFLFLELVSGECHLEKVYQMRVFNAQDSF